MKEAEARGGRKTGRKREGHGEERKTRKLNRNRKREKKQEGGRKKLK